MSALSSEIKTTYSRAPQSPVERASRCEVKPHRVLATACTLGGRGTRPLGSWSAGSGGVTGGRWKVEDALATTLLIGCWRLKWGRPTNIILTSARHAVVLHNTTPAYGSSQSAFPKSIPVFTACGVLWSTDAYRAAVSPSQACTTKRRTDPLTPKLPVSHPIIYRRIMVRSYSARDRSLRPLNESFFVAFLAGNSSARNRILRGGEKAVH